MLALFAILAWAAPFLAQDDAQTCSFALSSDGSLLGQVDSGQVVGTPEAHGSSAEESGTVFHLRGGGLYDAAMRGCWWPEPSTVLVCSLLPPAYPDPFFALDSDGHLVYNTSRRDFWACPANPGGDGGDSYYYYLDPPADMPRDGDDDGGLCKKVTIDGGVLNGFRCNNIPGSSSSSSSSSSFSSSSSATSSSSASSSSATSTSTSSASSSSSLSSSSSSSSSESDEVSETLAMSWGQFSWTETVVSILTTDGWDWLGEPTTAAETLADDTVVVTVTSTVPESTVMVTVTHRKQSSTTEAVL